MRPINRCRQGSLHGRAASGFAGALSGMAGLPRVVAAKGRSLSRWFDAHLLGLGWAEAVPMVPPCPPISGWLPCSLCHVCAAVCHLISVAVPLRFLEGPLAGRRDLEGGRGKCG